MGVASPRPQQVLYTALVAPASGGGFGAGWGETCNRHQDGPGSLWQLSCPSAEAGRHSHLGARAHFSTALNEAIASFRIIWVEINPECLADRHWSYQDHTAPLWDGPSLSSHSFLPSQALPPTPSTLHRCLYLLSVPLQTLAGAFKPARQCSQNSCWLSLFLPVPWRKPTWNVMITYRWPFPEDKEPTLLNKWTNWQKFYYLPCEF